MITVMEVDSVASGTIKYVLDDEVTTVTPTAASGYSIVNHSISKCGRIVSLFFAITKSSGTFSANSTIVATIPTSFAPKSTVETALLANSAMGSNGFKASIDSSGNVLIQGVGTLPTWINVVAMYMI